MLTELNYDRRSFQFEQILKKSKMKYFLLTITFLIAFGWQANAQQSGTCGDFTVTLEDSWIWGWEGGFIDIYVNGTLFLGGVTVVQSSTPDTVLVPMDISDIISITYTPGMNSVENQYNVYDETGIEVAAQGVGNTTPGNVGDHTIPTGPVACEPTGIESASSAIDLNIFPNPNNGSFTLELNSINTNELEIKILNTHGQVVFIKSQFEDFSSINELIDLRDRAGGIYFVVVTTDIKTQIKKLILH